MNVRAPCACKAAAGRRRRTPALSLASNAWNGRPILPAIEIVGMGLGVAMSPSPASLGTGGCGWTTCRHDDDDVSMMMSALFGVACPAHHAIERQAAGGGHVGWTAGGEQARGKGRWVTPRRPASAAVAMNAAISWRESSPDCRAHTQRVSGLQGRRHTPGVRSDGQNGGWCVVVCRGGGIVTTPCPDRYAGAGALSQHLVPIELCEQNLRGGLQKIPLPFEPLLERLPRESARRHSGQACEQLTAWAQSRAPTPPHGLAVLPMLWRRLPERWGAGGTVVRRTSLGCSSGARHGVRTG